VIECVANVSEGRDIEVLRALAEACAPALLDVHSDADHHRSVFTLAAQGTPAVQRNARALAEALARRVDISAHEGVHPRLGALDVVPFVALTAGASERERAIDAATSFAQWWSTEYEVPVFLYGAADPLGRGLPDTRRTAFQGRAPDYGPPSPHARLGATAVGVRPPLVALNCVLATGEVEIAQRIARTVREQTGGLPGVRALGFRLDSVGRAQVSMNLVDLDRTGIEAACRRVREEAIQERTDVGAIELVGLVPQAELERCSDEFLGWSGLGADSTIEARLRAGPGRRPGG
jgi:glutamate formiminotransferase